MAILFTDGFDWASSISDLITYGKWLDRSGFGTGSTSSNVRFSSGSGAYIESNNAGNYLRRAIGQNLSAGVIGIALRVNFNAGGYKSNIITLQDTTSNPQLGLLLNNDLTVSIFRGSHANILGTTTATLTTAAWTFIEFKWKIANSIASGDVVLKFNETSVLDLAATTDTQETANAYATHYIIRGNSPTVTSPINVQWYLDDHYLIDLTGSINNDFLGNIRVLTISPSGNGNSSDFTGSDGNSTDNYALVDDSGTSTADYVESGTVGHKDTYAHADTLATTTLIKGVSYNIIAVKTDTDPRVVCPVVRHSGTDYDGDNITLTETYSNHQQVLETNPGTSSDWTKSDVDSAEFGTKVVS